jgi:hypothetical protein
MKKYLVILMSVLSFGAFAQKAPASPPAVVIQKVGKTEVIAYKVARYISKYPKKKVLEPAQPVTTGKPSRSYQKAIIIKPGRHSMNRWCRR